MTTDLLQFSNKFIFNGAFLYIFDLTMGLSNNKSMYDALNFGLSSGLIEILVNRIIKNDFVPGLSQAPSDHKMLKSYIIKPALISLLYGYMYDSWYRDKYSSNNLDLRSKNENYLLSFVLSGLVNFVNNPLMSLFGWNWSQNY